MGRSVLFISDVSSSFFLNSVITNLQKAGYDCELVDYNVQRIKTVHMTVDAYFLLVGSGANTRCYDELKFINEEAKNRKKKVFLLGNEEDINPIADIIEEDNVWCVFIRPINVNDISDEIIRLMGNQIITDNRKDILLVDDSATILHTMKQWLEPTYKVAMVTSASNGITYLAKHRPDLILLDYEMPVCDGPTMLSMLRSDPNFANIPVMFLTGNGDRASIEKVLSLNPQGYLLKSLPREKILEALASFFNK